LRLSSEREVDWDLFGVELADTLVNIVSKLCLEEPRENPLVCLYNFYFDADLYDLAERFLGSHGITNETLELLGHMPDREYRLYNAQLQGGLMKLIREVEDIAREICEEWCREKGDEESFADCVQECINRGDWW
jgi:hypothetical protein